MNQTNQPIKGTSDWLPDEFSVRKYIFDTWRSVCTRFGYQEYLTPLLEPAELYRAKSGEDVGGVELTTLSDRAGRELAIRPEMTPSVTRLVSKIYSSTPKPIRLFSIANFFRNENPQRGRNREFWQLNFDIFGSNSPLADLEIIQLAIEIMLGFNPPAGSFKVRLNSRKLVEQTLKEIPKEQLKQVFRILDKLGKLPADELKNRLVTLGLTEKTVIDLLDSLSQKSTSDPEIKLLLDSLSDLGYSDWVEFNPQVMRGFDYYDGMVFEVFDTQAQNTRALFGGGRYNGLGALFGGESFPGVGCAPGDETTKLFLESWNLLPDKSQEKYYLPLLDESLKNQSLMLATKLRSANKVVEFGLEIQTLSKALEYANKRNFANIVIFGTQESDKNEFLIKNLNTNTQQTFTLT